MIRSLFSARPNKNLDYFELLLTLPLRYFQLGILHCRSDLESNRIVSGYLIIAMSTAYTLSPFFSL